jgi:hypothetical protein
MPELQLSWVRSQHPPTQWNLRGGDEAVLNKVLEKSKKDWISYRKSLIIIFYLYLYFRLSSANFLLLVSVALSWEFVLAVLGMSCDLFKQPLSCPVNSYKYGLTFNIPSTVFPVIQQKAYS